MACTLRIAKVVVISCLLWLISFPLLGGGAWGKDTFASWAGKSFLHDEKGGVPILMLTFPILIAGSVASLFTTAGNLDPSHLRVGRTRSYGTAIFSIQKRLPGQQTVFLWFMLLICFVYVLESASRKLAVDMSVDKALMKSGNIFGMLAVVVLSWILVPVSHRGPLGRLFQWDSIKVVSFHMWSGRIIIVASTIHGLEHTMRYALQGKDVFKAFYFPPVGCWKNPQTYVPEVCDKGDDDEECSCYDHFLPITGIAALVGLVLIGLSSRHKIRRENFATFATLHYILTPLTFLAISIHYNKAILYASGSLLYYLASNVPVWIETFFKQNHCGLQSNVKVTSVEILDCDSKDNPNRPCVALTMAASEATMRQFYPGAYVNLLVPSISKVSHPFTINRVRGETNQIRVIFRVTGPFTRAFEHALFFRSATTVPLIAGHEEHEPEEFQNDHLSADYHPSIALPRLYLDGYYGSGRLLSQILSHDVCVLVAAGIGITPYLSLLSELISTSDGTICGVASDGLMMGEPQSGAVQRPRQIILHWMCRDKSLIEYCRKEYMEFSSNDLREINGKGDRCSVKIIIHKTGGDNPELDESNHPTNLLADTSQHGGVPFDLSNFSPGYSMSDRLRYFAVFFALSWGGLFCLWLGYKRQSKSEYIHRLYTVATIMLYVLIVGLLANFVLYLCSSRTKKKTLSDRAFNGNGNGSSEKSNDVELTTYKDKTHLSPSETVPVGPVEDPLHLSGVILEISEGRPLLENILEDLDVERSSAMFCCVPEHISKNLREGINRNSILDDRYNTIAMYQESFEK